jgi:tetratricopeptide (TPR) repeat protein
MRYCALFVRLTMRMLTTKNTSFLLLFTLFSFTSFAQKSAELLVQANRATLERDYSKAIDLYNQYIALNPEDFRGYFNRGTTEYNAEMFTEGLKDFSKTIELNPVYREAYYYRGQCHTSLKNYAAAIADYNHILDKDEVSVPFLKLRSEAYIAQEKYDLALTDINTALSVDKLSGDLYKRRAELRLLTNDIEGAIRDYSSVEKLIPNYKMVHFIKGNLYLRIQESDFACEEFKKALDNKVMVADRPYKESCK